MGTLRQAMRRLVFPRGAVCGWTEPPFSGFRGPLLCIADPAAQPPEARVTLSGRLQRVPTCELLYGPFNCEFKWRADNWRAPAGGSLHGSGPLVYIPLCLYAGAGACSVHGCAVVAATGL